jgi:hypothetical protein
MKFLESNLFKTSRKFESESETQPQFDHDDDGTAVLSPWHHPEASWCGNRMLSNSPILHYELSSGYMES